MGQIQIGQHGPVRPGTILFSEIWLKEKACSKMIFQPRHSKNKQVKHYLVLPKLTTDFSIARCNPRRGVVIPGIKISHASIPSIATTQIQAELFSGSKSFVPSKMHLTECHLCLAFSSCNGTCRPPAGRFHPEHSAKGGRQGLLHTAVNHAQACN